MGRQWLFFIVILLANIIQGITGFAGTVLAMPFGLMLVGYSLAKPLLNVLGLLSGIWLLLANRRCIQWHELKKILLVMAPGILAGIGIKHILAGSEIVLGRMLGVFVMALGLQGLLARPGADRETSRGTAFSELALLAGAGIAHGVFVSGGPLLIGYLAKKVTDKQAFRATISAVWIVLNSMLLVSDLYAGLWTAGSLRSLILSLPFLAGGMAIGGRLYRSMSQALFMKLTYLLLLLAGLSLLL